MRMRTLVALALGATVLTAGHGLNADHRALIDEQSDYFLYYAMDLAHAQQ